MSNNTTPTSLSFEEEHLSDRVVEISSPREKSPLTDVNSPILRSVRSSSSESLNRKHKLDEEEEVSLEGNTRMGGEKETFYKGSNAKRTRLDPVLRDNRQIAENSLNPRRTQKITKSKSKTSMFDPDTTKYIEEIVLGGYVIKTWHSSPYPDEYNRAERLYTCEHCMRYMKSGGVYGRHITTCHVSPPGIRIYEGMKGDQRIRIYEVDGAKGTEQKLYGQMLSLLGKNWLETKMICYDVEGFCFYVLVEVEEDNGKEIEHTMGFFSKEKFSYGNYNLACICVFPHFQKKGYGRLLIELSYELSKRERKVGSPEEPVSQMARHAYMSYWRKALLRTFCHASDKQISTFNVDELSQMTAIQVNDINAALRYMGLSKLCKKGTRNTVVITKDMIMNYVTKTGEKWERPELNVSLLVWEPRD